jgi:hypothetical protein
MIKDFPVLVGAIAAALSIVGSGYGGMHWWKARRVRTRLEISVGRLQRQEHRLGGVIRELDRRLAEGPGWAGWSVWPDKLGGELTYAAALADEAEREEAMVRSLDARGADERLRRDVEELHRVLSRVASACVEGTLDANRSSNGDPIPSSPGGREVTPALGSMDEAQLLEARRRFTTLMRTCRHRLGRGDHWSREWAEAFASSWPVYRWEASDVDLDAYWGGEVRPLRWG